MDVPTCRRLLASAPVARLATIGPKGPQMVPMTFALDGETIVTAVDHKPKSTRRLRRIRNIESDDRVSVLADWYDDDWSKLWWVRADGTARVVSEGVAFERAVDRLRAKYPQYRARPPAGPAILIEVDRWVGWRAAE